MALHASDHPLAAQANGLQGIPESVVPSGPLAGIEQLLAALSQGGGIPPELLMQLLALLTGGDGGLQGPGPIGPAGPVGPAGPAGASPIEAALAQVG